MLNAALVFVIVLTLGACTDRPETEEMVADTARVVTEDTTGMMADTTPTDTIEVELVAFKIEMPEQIQAGSRVFSIRNVGEIQHAFEIEGQGSEWVVDNINPEETETLTADLQPGTYTVYCPVSDHRQEGMEMTLTVTPSQATAETGLDAGTEQSDSEAGVAQGATGETEGAY